MANRKVTVYIKDLDLSQRNANALLRKGIVTLNQLEEYNIDEIVAIKGVGKDSLEEIYDILDKKDDIFRYYENRLESKKRIPADVCSIDILELSLSARAQNALTKAQINTIGELIHTSKQDISKLPNIGDQTRAEINSLIEEVFSLYQENNNNEQGTVKSFISRKVLINNVPADVCNIGILEIDLSARAQNALIKAKINTVGELIHTSKQDISKLPNIGNQTIDEIYNLIDNIISSDGDFDPKTASDNVISVHEDKWQVEEKGFDFETIDMLKKDFSISITRMTDWFGLSRQGIYNALDKRSNKRKQKWTGKELTQEEYGILLSLIENKKFEYNDDNVRCDCFNDKKGNFIAIFIYENEIKAFFLSELPDMLRDLIVESNMQKYTERELSGESDGSIVYFLKQPYFTPDDPKKFGANAAVRKMTVDEYSIFLTGYPYSAQRIIDDKKVIEFFENSLVNGKVHISSESQNQWIKSIASRNGYGIKEFVEFYGYKYYMEDDELSVEGAKQRHIQELKKYITEGNTVYFPTDSKIYKVLHAYTYRKGISLNDYVRNLGFERAVIPPERQINILEEDMQPRNIDGEFEDRVFGKYPLLGSKIMKQDTLDKLDENTKKYIDTVLHEQGVKLKLRAEMQITLSVINHAKNWDNEENSKFWKYIALQYGYRNANGTVENVIKTAVEDALKKNNKFFIEGKNGREFKASVVVHALTPRRCWMTLFDFLFDFYKNNLNWELVQGDPLIEIMIHALQSKFSGIESDDTEMIEIGSGVYRFQEGIRKLVSFRPGYSRKLFEKLLGRINGLINSADLPIETFEDQLCDEWFKEKLGSIANSKKSVHRDDVGEREVAIDYFRIKAKLVLYQENQIMVELPDIRLKNEDFSKVVLTIRYNDVVVYQQPMIWYGNELGKTLKGVSIPLPDFTDSVAPFNIRVSIECDDKEIYDSGTDLYYKLLAFSEKRGINPARINRGNYTLVLPEDAVIECENVNLTMIDPFKNGGVKAYFAELREGYFLTINGMPVAVDHESGPDIRIIAPIERNDDPTFRMDETEYHFVKNGSYCSVVIDNREVLKRYALLVNNSPIALENQPVQVTEQGETYSIPIIEEDGLCRIRIMDLNNEKLLYERNFCVVSNVAGKFDREFYYFPQDYKDAKYQLQIDDFCETVYFTKEDDEIQIPYRNGFVHVNIPKITVDETTGKWFHTSMPAWHIDEIPQDSFLKVSAPSFLTIRFLIGGIDIRYDGGGLVGIGNVLHSMQGSDIAKDVPLQMKVTGAQQTQSYILTRVFYKEGFLKEPNFWTEKNQLFWNQGGSFIGKSDRTFILQLKGEDGNEITFKVDRQTIYIDLPPDLPLGNYQYELSILSGGVFKTTKEIIAKGDCIIGDINAFRFRNHRIVIDSITEDGNKVSEHIQVNTCYIDQIQYLGEEDTSEGYCPVYSGLLYTLDNSGQRYNFSDLYHTNKRGIRKMSVNPVRIIYINDNTLSVTNSEEDGLYYYHYFDKYFEQTVYALTDREYTTRNKGQYSIADLYSYHTEEE